jgi:solute carrier family 12 sodium/potassium/chloride transporter 2
VDVWGLFDDGGLNILMPYLLMQRSHWNKCKLRLFIQNNQTKSISEEQRNMATLLSKFRIKFHERALLVLAVSVYICFV